MSTTTFTATTNFYEVLGIRKDATQEEVRKAYRKRALQTHPDRLPQNVTPEEKKAAEAQFRLVNNAYEVLNNADDRKLYDKHGVWPPPTEQPEYPQSNSHQSFRNDPFANGPFFSSSFGSRGRRGHGFTDPFELFNSLFGDLHSAFDNDPLFAGTPFFRSPFDDPFFRSTPFDDPFFRSPFGGPSAFGGSLFGNSPFGTLMGGSMFPQIEGGSTKMYSSRTEAVGRNGQWVSRSQMTRTVNGRTEVIVKQIDAEGNEHITYSSPDGERYTINGIEQPAHANRPIEAPRRSETYPQARQQPQPIADAPAQPANYYIPQQQQQQAYSVPISGPANAQASPTNNAYLDRAHSSRSRHSTHRDRPSAEEAPRRSYSARTSAASPRPPTDPRVSGHTHADRSSYPPHVPATTAPAERLYGGHDPAAATANGYYDTRSRESAYARDPRRDSVQSGHSHHSYQSGKTHGTHRSASRHDGHEREREREKERAGQVPPPVAEQQPGHHHRHSQRGWRGWLSSVLHPLRLWHHDKHNHDHNHEHEHEHDLPRDRQQKERPVSAHL